MSEIDTNLFENVDPLQCRSCQHCPVPPSAGRCACKEIGSQFFYIQDNPPGETSLFPKLKMQKKMEFYLISDINLLIANSNSTLEAGVPHGIMPASLRSTAWESSAISRTCNTSSFYHASNFEIQGMREFNYRPSLSCQPA